MKKKTIIVIAVLVVLSAALAAGGYYWFTMRWDENRPYASYRLEKYITLGEYTGLEVEYGEQPDFSAEKMRELTKTYFAACGVSLLEENESKTVVEDGDFIRIVFIGTAPDISDRVVQGLANDNWELEIGKESFIPGFDEQLIGREISEESFKFKLKFPEDYFEPELAGKLGTFECVVQAIGTVNISDMRVQLLPAPMGRERFESVEDLHGYFRVEIAKKAVERNEQALLDAAFKNATVKIFPERELTYFKAYLEERKAIEIEGEELEELRNNIEQEMFLFAVAEEEGLLVGGREYKDYLDALQAGNDEMTDEELHEAYGSRGLIIRGMVRGKVMKFLINKAEGFPKVSAK